MKNEMAKVTKNLKIDKKMFIQTKIGNIKEAYKFDR
jgi:hypothetical protein